MQRHKLLSIMMLGSGILAASAAINNTPLKFEGNHSGKFIPAKFSADNKTSFLFTEEDDDHLVTKGMIYSKEMQLVKTIDVPDYPAVTAKQSVQQAQYGPLVGTGDTSRNRVYDATSSAEAEAFVRNQFGSEPIKKSNGDTIDYYYPNYGAGDYYCLGECYGDKYPSLYYSYVASENAVYQVYTQYYEAGYGVIGWSDPEEQTMSKVPGVIEMEYLTEVSRDTHDLIFTQHLFNNDDLYEWVIPIYSTVSITNESEYVKISGEQVVCTGFEVKSENGTSVASVNFPSGYYTTNSGDNGATVYDFGDVYYISIEDVRNDESGDYYTLMYKVDAEAGMVRMATDPIRSKVMPTTPTAGTPVTVELGKVTDKGANVSVFAANGSRVSSQAIQPGQTRATIATDGLTRGMYIVVVTEGTSAREATKIIVR